MEDPAQKPTKWLLYFVCEGFGLTTQNILDPLGKSQQKCCCIKQDASCGLTNDIMGEGGLCAGTSKMCCIEQAFQFPPKTPFIEFCGIRVCGGNKVGATSFGNASSVVPVGDAETELQEIRRELDVAIQAEDFEKALELKHRRDNFLANCQRKVVPEIPDNLSM